jgi:anthranilate phosphoribosyltransferase
VLEQLCIQPTAAESLSEEQVARAVEQLIDESVSVASKADFLTRLALKGETAEEIAAFVRALRARCLQPPLEAQDRASDILDVVGTGGDRLGTFNISTTVALLAAAAGARVAKHGNRASTSPVGSADVLEALGIPFDHAPEQAVRLLRRHGFAFFFAPKYHPAFRHIAPARRLCAERGQTTIFNFLGPLLNPAQPSAMLLGVPRPELCEPLARVLQSVGVRRAMVVCGSAPGEDGSVCYLDEISTLGPTTVAEFYQERALARTRLSLEGMLLQPATLADLRGGTGPGANATIIRRLLTGEDRGPKRDIVLLNAGAALWLAGLARSMAAGWELAAAVIDSGRAGRKLEELAQCGGVKG